jgi:diguanylate cyclase (GGDEF)-like protein
MRDTPRVLIVDDDEGVLELLADTLRGRDYSVQVASDGADALRQAQRAAQRGRQINVVILDLKLTDYRPSLPLIPRIREFHPVAEFICITAHYQVDRGSIIDEAFRKYEVYDFLAKPIKPFPHELEVAVRRACRSNEVRRRLSAHHESLVRLSQDWQVRLRGSESRHRELETALCRARLARLEGERISGQVIEAGQRLLGARDVGNLLRRSVEAVQSVVPSEATVVLFRKAFEEHPELEKVFPEEDLSSLIHKIHLRGGDLEEGNLEAIGSRLAEQVIASGQVAQFPGRSASDVMQTTLAVPDSTIRSALCVPLVNEERGVIGVIQLYNRLTSRGRLRERGFHDADVRVLREIASFLALGVLSYYEIGHDPLTQLYNRRVLRQRAESEIERQKRRGGDLDSWFALVDVDHFRLYNETSGYLVADGVLKEVARTLQTAIRDHDFVARFGGEEFCLILTQIESEAMVRQVLARIRESVARLTVPNQEKMPFKAITVSIGASKICLQDTFEDVFHRANQALKRAKVNRNEDEIESAPA